jgi:hypothetical protein
MLFITNFENYFRFSLEDVKQCKKNRKVSGLESIVRAVKVVRDKKMGLLKASKMFNIPGATLNEIGMVLVTTVSVVWTSLLRGWKRRKMGTHSLTHSWS